MFSATLNTLCKWYTAIIQFYLRYSNSMFYHHQNSIITSILNLNKLTLCKFTSCDGPRPFLISFLLPSWRAVRSYRPHLEKRDPIWGDEWSHSPFIRLSPSWGFLGVSSAVRQMPGDLCTAPRIIPLSPLSVATNVTDTTLGASGLWLGIRTGAGGTATWAKRFFGHYPMAPWTTGYFMSQFHLIVIGL